MRVILYLFAIICGILSFAALVQPLIAALLKERDGIANLMTLGIVANFAPIALALTIIPLCIAVAFDLATRK